MDNSTGKQRRTGRISKLGMTACCIIMLAPIAAVLLAGGGFESFTGNLGLVLPLALCLGMHFFMHRGMGRTCDRSSERNGSIEIFPEEVVPKRHPLSVQIGT